MNENEQFTQVMLKMVMLHRLRVCFLNVQMKRQMLESELLEIQKICKNASRGEREQLKKRENYLNAKVSSLKNQERRLYQKLKWMQDKLENT